MATTPKQRVSTNSLVENLGGTAHRAEYSTNALAPSVGNLQNPIPNTTRLVGVDFQVVSATVSIANGTYPYVTWPSVGLTNLFSNQPRYYTAATSATAKTMQPTTASSLVVGQTTQLLLMCSVQTYTPATANLWFTQINFQTLGFETNLNVGLTGPWFPGGTTYLAFSVTPQATVYNVTGGLYSGPLTLGISAQLFSVFTS